jgi:hypothetical protein
MSKITETDYPTFREYYDSLPERNVVVAPKTAFVRRMATITMKSTKTVWCWLAGVQKPDALCQSLIEKELKIPCENLFPPKPTE